MKKGAFLIVCIILVLSCSNRDNCKPIDVFAFTHYQINEGSMKVKDFISGIKVFDKPNGSIIFNLPPDDEAGWGVVLIDEEDNYFKIENIWSQEYAKSHGGYWANVWKKNWMSGYQYVWIEKGTVGLNTTNYQGELINLYKNPDETSQVVGQLDKEQTVKVLDACGQWAYIEGTTKNNKKVRGWLSKKWQCGDPYSPCS